MSADSTIQKVCVACGRDCSAGPHTRDAKGRYYCKACDDAAVAKASSAVGHAPYMPHQSALDGSASASCCPECGSPMEAHAVVCTICGHHEAPDRPAAPPAPAPPVPTAVPTPVVTHDEPAAHVDSTQPPPVAIADVVSEVESPAAALSAVVVPGEPAWPTVVGVISTIFGAAGALLHGGSTLLAIISATGGGDGGGAPAVRTGQVLMSLLMAGLSVWLLVSGIGLVRRRVASVTSLRRWAIVKAGLYGSCLGLSLFLIAVLGEISGDLSEALTGSAESLRTGSVVIALLAGFAWLLLWPVFVLVWLAREPVRQQIAEWA